VGIRVALLSVGVAVLLAWQATAQLLLTGRVQLVPGESRIEFFVRDNRGGFWGRATEMEGVRGPSRPTGCGSLKRSPPACRVNSPYEA